MLQGGGTFGTFMSIGTGIRCWPPPPPRTFGHPCAISPPSIIRPPLLVGDLQGVWRNKFWCALIQLQVSAWHKAVLTITIAVLFVVNWPCIQKLACLLSRTLFPFVCCTKCTTGGLSARWWCILYADIRKKRTWKLKSKQASNMMHRLKQDVWRLKS